MLKDIKVGDIVVLEDGTERTVDEVRTDKPFGPNWDADVWLSFDPRTKLGGHFLWDGTNTYTGPKCKNIIEIKVRQLNGRAPVS